MRARGLGGLIGLLVSCVLTGMTMRACQSSGGSSPTAPLNVARNGTAGVCANRQAVADAGPDDDPVPPVTLPPDLAARLHQADPAAAAIADQAANCPTETT